MGPDRTAHLIAFEQEAEKLVVYQTDVIAQIEHQLRAARQTIRSIQMLRAARFRGEARELTNGERRDTLEQLAEEWSDLDAQLTTQHESCVEILNTIKEMRKSLNGLRKHRSSAGLLGIPIEQQE